MTKDEKEDSEEEEEDLSNAKAWLLGQRVAKRNYKPEAFAKYWSEKQAEEQRAWDEEKERRERENNNES